jgi:hypothetical protein
MAASAADWFAGRLATIATMHRKEQVIAPALETELGLTCQVPSNFNTDAFGTFTRDVDRSGDQRTTARRKAEAALDLTGGTLAIASEGSFGPHPQIPFMPCNREVVLLLDQQHGLEIVGEYLSTDTNYRAEAIASVEAALAFAQSVGFPHHGLVVMPQSQGNAPDSIFKGITQDADLIAAVETLLVQSPQGRIHIETDMRAMHNPKRMQAIAQRHRRFNRHHPPPVPRLWHPRVCPGGTATGTALRRLRHPHLADPRPGLPLRSLRSHRDPARPRCTRCRRPWLLPLLQPLITWETTA